MNETPNASGVQNETGDLTALGPRLNLQFQAGRSELTDDEGIAGYASEVIIGTTDSTALLESRIKIEPSSQTTYLMQDSDVICIGSPVEEVINISEEISTQELFVQCNSSGSSMFQELVTSQTQPTPQVSQEFNI